MPEKIAGLPAHPLIVHLPIVLGPLVGLLAILCLIPAWRDRLVWPTAGLAVLFAVAAIAAVSSGEALARTLQIGDGIAEHADAARTLRLVAMIFAVTLVAVAALRKKLPGLVQHGALVAVAALGVATIGFTVKTGHEGATAVWKSAYEAAEEASQDSP